MSTKRNTKRITKRKPARPKPKPAPSLPAVSAAAAPAVSSMADPNILNLRYQPGETPEVSVSRLVAAGLVSNVTVLTDWRGSLPPAGLTPLVAAVTESADRAKSGDLGDGEALLMAQALALNALFTDLLHRARYAALVAHQERYLKFGLRAQSQCRATLETLSAIKNPPTVFAKQANIAAGHQQVNNSLTLPAGSRAGETGAGLNKLLEAGHERLDFSTATATAEVDPQLAPVGILDGTADAGGKGAVREECVQGRGAGELPPPHESPEGSPGRATQHD